MNQDGVLMPHLMLKLAYRFQKGLALNISDCPAYFNNCNPVVFPGHSVIETALDLIRYMGNYLYGSAAIISVPLLLKDRPVDLPRRNVRIPIQTLVDEPDPAWGSICDG